MSSKSEQEAQATQVFSAPSAPPGESGGAWGGLAPGEQVPRPGELLAGRYTVLHVLGQGGMGVVLAAYDSRLDRRVALKLLKPQREASESLRTRLLREALAMARLSHPNVVAVHDAGELEEGRLFIAMEHVEGQTLRAWSQGEARTWRQILAAYLDAGRGLAAAHAAGLVHRDFKPDNVLVGVDGRARVTDFGVARSGAPAPSSSALGELSLAVARAPQPAGAWDNTLTQPGMLVGTPKYMAPELLLGQPANERSDLFSFCVALWESLFHQPPFAGLSMQERVQSMTSTQPTPPPDTQVPTWVARALQQGLRLDPGQRPGSMAELLRVLEDDPQVRRRALGRATALACTLATLAALAAWGLWRQGGPGCSRMQERLAGVWDETVRERVRQALLGTGLPHAPDTAARVEAVLEGQARDWVRLRTEACKAAHAQGDPTRGLVPLQEACLERRRSQLTALTALLARGPDTELADRAVQVAHSLPPLADCTQAHLLTAAVAPPEEPALRARVEGLQQQVDRLAALHEAGKYQEGLEASKALLQEVAAVDYPPLQAHAHYEVARLQQGAGDYPGAEARAREALLLAARGRDDAQVARVLGQLVLLLGDKQARPQEALGLAPAVEAAAERTLEEPARAATLHGLGSMLAVQGRYEEARGRLERALALRRKALGPEHPEVALSLSTLGHVLRSLGRLEEARAAQQEALALRERVLGPQHPALVSSLNGLANTLQVLGRYEEARPLYERALPLARGSLGPRHPVVALTLNNLGSVLQQLGRYEQAQASYEQALSLREQQLGAEHPEVASTLNNLGLLLLERGRPEEARARLERALALRRKALGPEHPKVASTLDNLGTALLQLGRYEQARAAQEEALALRRKALGPEHPEVALSLGNLGTTLLYLGRHAEARARLERALALSQQALGAGHPDEVQLLVALGRLLVRKGEWEAAERHLRQALALQEKALGPQHPQVAVPLLGLGELHLARGQPAQALPPLERALALSQSSDNPELLFTLAQAQWSAAGERPRAQALAHQARAHWQRLGHTPKLTECSRWLDSLPPATPR